MSMLSQQARPAVEKLLQADESQLYEILGMRAQAMALDTRVAGTFEPTVTYDVATMGLKEDIQSFGKRLFARWHREAFNLVCGKDAEDEDDRKSVLEALGVGEVGLAAVLAGLLVAHVGMAPALAAVVAALITKRFFNPVYEEFCETWSAHAPEGG